MNSRRHSYLLMLGHLFTDINQGSLSALLPFLMIIHEWSYTATATLIFANSLISALIQPLFGYLGEKVDHPGFMSLGIFLAGIGIAAIGFVDSYPLVFCCVVVMGIGVALFHPEGAKLANIVAGKSKGEGISNFTVGGNLGFTCGPLLLVFAISTFGMWGTALYLIFATVFPIFLLSQTKAFKSLTIIEVERIKNSDMSKQKDDWVGFTKSSMVSIMRSIISNGMHTFIPLYWIGVFGQTEQAGALMLALYSAGGAVATFFGGRVADRVGFKKILAVGIGSVGPLLLIFLMVQNVILAAILILLCGIMNCIGHASVVALGQAYLPNHLGFASGISFGVAVSMGGLATSGLGAIADTWGLPASMATISLAAFIGVSFTSLLFMGRNARDGIGVSAKKK